MSQHRKTPVSRVDAEQFQRFIAGVTDYAIYMLTPDGYVSSWNQGAQRFKGYTADEIIGEHFSRFYTEEDRAAGMPAKSLQTAINEGRFEAEGWRVRKDGTRFWANVVLDPIRDDKGELIGYAKVTRDITERKNSQDALRASEERFRRLVQGVTDYAIYMLSPAGIVTNWNAGAERIKGYKDTEIVGHHFSEFYTEEDRAAGLPALSLATATKNGSFEKEGWRQRKDGTRFWAHVVIDAIRDEQGELIGFAKVTRDITERRNAAEALERTKEALFQSQKLEAIGKLTGGIAHDFNNLLAIMVSGLELLARETLSPSGAKMLDSMQRAADRAGALTQQLLTFARQQPLRQDKHNLNRVIESFETVLRRACEDCVTFDVQLDRGLKPVMIDATQFEAALLNLVTNARDAMSDGGSLQISTQNVTLHEGEVRQLAAGPYVRVTVTDSGTGMPPDVAARAVEPFFTTKGIGKGTGMGLSQVYGLVQQSGGELVIDTAVGQGTSMSIYLPAVASNGDADADESSADVEKILLVDDEAEVLTVASELFTLMGYEVLLANNGDDALSIMQRTPGINVLFTDVQMPGMNGVSLAKKTRALHPDMKIILASGFAPTSAAIEQVDLNSFDFIRKPYRLAELTRKLRSAR